MSGRSGGGSWELRLWVKSELGPPLEPKPQGPSSSSAQTESVMVGTRVRGTVVLASLDPASPAPSSGDTAMALSCSRSASKA